MLPKWQHGTAQEGHGDQIECQNGILSADGAIECQIGKKPLWFGAKGRDGGLQDGDAVGVSALRAGNAEEWPRLSEVGLDA